jgi:hypothetical protein
MSVKENTYCGKLKETIITPSNEYKWFFPFLVTLLNEKSIDIIKINDKEKPDIKYEKLKDFFNLIINPIQISNYNITAINKFIDDFVLTTDGKSILYQYLIENNLFNYFLLPLYLKYLGFSCISFEYNNKLYGGVYNYLQINDNYCKINAAKMLGSRGLIYDQRQHYHPDYLLINIWDDNDTSLDYIKDDLQECKDKIGGNIFKSKIPSQKIQYNGYNYILQSYLLTNYNSKEYKVPEHTISLTKCNNKFYVFTNSFKKIIEKKEQKKEKEQEKEQVKKQDIKSFLLSFNPLQKKKEKSFEKSEEKFNIKPCTALIELDKIDKKMLLPENSCDLQISKDNTKIKEQDIANNYCFSIKKGKRVLIYIKADKYISPEEKAKKDAEEKAKKEADEAAKGNKGKNPEKKETQEEQAKREQDEKLCTTIIDYLGKIKTNQDKDKLFQKLVDKKTEISDDLDKLKAERENYDKEREKLEKMKTEIEAIHIKHKDELDKMIQMLMENVKHLDKKKKDMAVVQCT